MNKIYSASVKFFCFCFFFLVKILLQVKTFKNLFLYLPMYFNYIKKFKSKEQKLYTGTVFQKYKEDCIRFYKVS